MNNSLNNNYLNLIVMLDMTIVDLAYECRMYA